MIYVKYKDDEVYYETKFKRINKNVVSVLNAKDVDTSGFETFSEIGSKLGDFKEYKTVYRVLNDEVWYSNDGSEYVEPQPFVPREPTADEIKQMLIDGVQNYMDELASARGYDGILSACSYINTGVERFDREGEMARQWRSKVWEYCYDYLDQVLEGKRDIPSLEALIRELPQIEW